jgi:hypothetical protein
MTIHNARIRLVAVGILAVVLKQQDNGKSKNGIAIVCFGIRGDCSHLFILKTVTS